jgi:hypothetical protein
VGYGARKPLKERGRFDAMLTKPVVLCAFPDGHVIRPA